jgi:GT2 family glycosyltransferase
MNVGLVTVGYNLPGSTRMLVDSARAGCSCELLFIIFSHAALPEKKAELEELAMRRDVVYHAYHTNRGLARSWNEGVLEARTQQADVVLVVNEDLRFGAGDVQRLAEAAVGHREHYLVTGRACHESNARWSTSEFACFAINPIGWETLGCFDENLFPVYYEDSDYRRRARLAHLSPWNCAETAMIHGGSQSLHQAAVAQQNQVTWSRNREYFRRKWGGDPDHETFLHPFNDGRFSCFIDTRVRDAPYPGDCACRRQLGDHPHPEGGNRRGDHARQARQGGDPPLLGRRVRDRNSLSRDLSFGIRGRTGSGARARGRDHRADREGHVSHDSPGPPVLGAAR